MEITYKREPNSSYMIIDCETEGSYFRERMIEENDIPSLLNFSKAGTGGKYSYWYDISMKKSLRTFFLGEGISVESIRDVFKELSNAYRLLGRYLLEPESVVLKPETLFVEYAGGRWKCYLAYLPGYRENFLNGLMDIADFLIQNVNHDNVKVTELCYEIYEKVNSGEVSIEGILDSLESHATTKKPDESDNLVYTERGTKNEEEVSFERTNEDVEFPNLWDEDDIFEEAPKKKSKKRFFDFIKRPKTKEKEKVQIKKEESEDFIIDEPVAVVQERESFGTTLLSPQENNFHRRLRYQGRGNHKDMSIEKTPFCIGSRESGNDGVIKEGVVSRNHARILIKEDEYFLEDLESRNGTFLNGQILAFGNQIKLEPGDRISFANVGFVFE